MKNIAQWRWKVEKLRIDLDERGEGEALYRVRAEKWEFHFFVLSKQLEAAQQVDRNFATSWDATAALCQGPWSPEREAYMRREIPQQVNGWMDYDTLSVSRANRSGRVFEHVVESLAAGRQPDPRQLSQVGYILRTTGFIGNGMSGTKPYRGYEPDHPLRRPYHPQMFAAFLFREFVFDLVETMAAARSPSAVVLAPPYKRYLGLGNSAATGLVRYTLNHPKQMHQWCMTWEAAFAAAKARVVRPGSPEREKLEALLQRAILHFRQDGRPASGSFADATQLANELAQIRERLLSFNAADGLTPFGISVLQELSEWAADNTHEETVEIFYSILLELFPDLVDHFAEHFEVDETPDVAPAMTNGELKSILQSSYAWAFNWSIKALPHERFFWFHSVKAPEDARRGYRYALPVVEHENMLETVRQVQKLAEHLEPLPADTLVGEIIAVTPALRNIITRVQSLKDCDYAEMRDNPLDSSFYPIPAIRLILAFYGMDKLESAPPKLVRGALLQGAPTADDVAAGIEGDWPFALFPEQEGDVALGDGQRPRVAAAQHIRHLKELAESSVRGVDSVAIETIRVSDAEFQKRARKALQAAGTSLGLAIDGSRAFAFAESTGQNGLKHLLSQLELDRFRTITEMSVERSDPHVAVIGALGNDPLVGALPALDLACAIAHRSANGVGAALLLGAQGAATLEPIAARAASRGLVAFVIDGDVDGKRLVTYAGPSGSQPWLAVRTLSGEVAQILDEALAPLQLSEGPRVGQQLLSITARSGAEGDRVIVCVDPKGRPLSSSAVSQLSMIKSETIALWSGSANEHRLQASRLKGLSTSRGDWQRLDHFASRLLVSVPDELQLREAGFDAAKQF